jgi:hypothetical protein
MPYKDRSKHREMCNRMTKERIDEWNAARDAGELLSRERTCSRCKTAKPLACFTPSSAPCKDCYGIWRDGLIAKGNCPLHNLPSLPGIKQCVKCKENDKARSEQKKANRKCKSCPNRGAWRTYCDSCREKQRLKSAAASKKRREQGLCWSCNNRAKDGHTMCHRCLELMKKKYDMNRQSQLDARKTIYRYRDAVRNATKKGREWTIPEDVFWKLIADPCHYCGGPCGVYGVGLDRKDNDKGYTEENCVPCCKRCNYTKGYFFTYEDMLVLAPAIREIDRRRNGNFGNILDTSGLLLIG